MKKRFFGRFVSAVPDTNLPHEPLVGYRVRLHLGEPYPTSRGLAEGVTDADGFAELFYRQSPTLGTRRTLEFTIEDLTGRRIPFMTANGRETAEDVDAEPISRSADFVVRQADARGLAATLGTGETSIRAQRFGWGLTHGNRVTTLMDEDAFRHAAALMRGAKQHLAVSQLFFPVPQFFDADPSREKPNLIFDFAGDQPDASTVRNPGVQPGDARPERLLLDANARGVDVRIVLNAVRVPIIVRIAAGALAFPFVGIGGVLGLQRWFSEHFTDTDEVKAYFSAANATHVQTEGFEQQVLTNAGVMHAKLMVADWTHALSIGSPFAQSYFDTHDHRVQAAIRGSSTGLPKHDAGFAITGPAVGHLQETIKLLWDTVRPDAKLESFPGPGRPEPPPLPPSPPSPGPRAIPRPELDAALQEDGVATVQIVRTLSSGRFPGVAGIPEDGEKGILEAYQRAIAAAQDFIYLETQYFTNDAIGEALVGALRAGRNRPGKPDLQAILVCNIEPDVPFYPFKQRRLIHRIREALGEDAKHPKWFGVFTRWAHEVASPRPRMLPIYVHAKAAVVDDRWATVGSANLDGLSLDSMLLWDWLNKRTHSELFRQQRAIEVNGCFLNEAGDSPVVDKLRRKLWAEHLGFFTATGGPDLQAPALQAPPAGGWLQLWNERAAATLQRAIDTPKESFDGFGCVLPWPARNSTFKTPRKHLDALGIKTYKVVPLKSTRAFDFASWQWDAKSTEAMDYD